MDIPRIGGTRGVSAERCPTVSRRPSSAAGVSRSSSTSVVLRRRPRRPTPCVERATQRSTTSLDVTSTWRKRTSRSTRRRRSSRRRSDAFERSRVHRDFAKAGVGAGLRPPIELTRAERISHASTSGGIRARGGLAIAQTCSRRPSASRAGSRRRRRHARRSRNAGARSHAIRQASARDPRFSRPSLGCARRSSDARDRRQSCDPIRADRDDLGARRRRAAVRERRAAEATGWLPGRAQLGRWCRAQLAALRRPSRAGDASRAREQVRRDEVAARPVRARRERSGKRTSP